MLLQTLAANMLGNTLTGKGVVCVYVCVCLQANHFDVIGLGVKVDQGLPCVCHYILRSSD